CLDMSGRCRKALQPGWTVAGIEPVLDDEPELGITADAQLALEKQGIGVGCAAQQGHKVGQRCAQLQLLLLAPQGTKALRRVAVIHAQAKIGNAQCETAPLQLLGWLQPAAAARQFQAQNEGQRWQWL